jgi:DNA-binding HxlR family transcriptional regulator
LLLKYYRQDIVDAIAAVLLDKKRLNYSDLYKTVDKKLGYLKESDKKGHHISHRDFSAQLTTMVNENRLIREEQEYDPNIRRMPEVYYSLTADAIKEHLFGVLGNDPVKERRRKLYHLFFFFQAFSPIRWISSYEQLNKALSSIGKSEKDLIPLGNLHTIGTNYSQVTYKSVHYAKISKVELSDEVSWHIANKPSKILYYYRLESFSLKEVKNHLTNSQIHNVPSEDNNAAVVRLEPFVSGIYFTGNEVMAITEEELDKALDILQKNDLIRPTINWLSDDENDKRSKDDVRFVFTDELLRELIAKIWMIQESRLDLLRIKMNDSLEAPTADEIQMLVRFYGEREADRLIHAAHIRRNKLFKNKRETQKKEALTTPHIEYHEMMAYGLPNNIAEKYGEVINKYNFPLSLIEGVCIGQIFTRKKQQ